MIHLRLSVQDVRDDPEDRTGVGGEGGDGGGAEDKGTDGTDHTAPHFRYICCAFFLDLGFHSAEDRYMTST